MIIIAEHYTSTVGTIEIIASPCDCPPLVAEAIVQEQDTALILGVPKMVRDTAESYETLIEKIRLQPPLTPGQIIVRNTRPVTILAIIHDLNTRPVFQAGWIAHALVEIFREVKRRHIRKLAMPLLGVETGKLPPVEFLRLLGSVICGIPAGYPERIWLITPAPECRRIRDQLRTATPG